MILLHSSVAKTHEQVTLNKMERNDKEVIEPLKLLINKKKRASDSTIYS